MKSYKRILLIGDNSLARNWGCRATTQCLKKLIAMRYPDAEILSLYHADYIVRDVTGPSSISRVPFAHVVPKFLKRSIKSTITRMFPIGKLYQFVSPEVIEKNILPNRIEDFDELAKRVLNGKMLSKELALMKQADLIIVNGEGSIYPGAIFEKYPLFLMYFAKKYLNKMCGFFNGSIKVENDEIAAMIRGIFPLLDRVVLREPFSIRELEKIGVTCPAILAPDAAFLLEPDQNWQPPPELAGKVDFDLDYICASTSAAIWYDGIDRTEEWLALITKLKEIVPQVVLLITDDNETDMLIKIGNLAKCPVIDVDIATSDAVNVLSKARLFVSGRYHPSIFAAVSGTPFIPLSANSYKIEGLVELLDYHKRVFPIMEIGNMLEEIVAEARQNIVERRKISDHLCAVSDNLRQNVYKQVEF